MLVWFIYGSEAKRHSKQSESKLSSWIRFLILAGFVLCLTVRDLRELNDLHLFWSNYFVQGLGVFICILGVCFAIRARIHIGKSWGLPMSLHESTVLVTTGPYRIVRHPIYAGLSLAMLGSMLTAGALFFVWYIIWTLYFLYSAVKEDIAMLHQFPIEYPEYKKKTKMIIPFIL